MPRKPRLEYAGAVYHVMSRGNGGQAIFFADGDRKAFLATLSEACERCGWQIHAYVLLPNHYHLLLETPEPNLVAGMKWLQGTFTQRFNSFHQRHGHLLQGRYKAVPVHAENPTYWDALSCYIHLNPVRAGLVGSRQMNLSKYPWSSFPAYIQPALRPAWLDTRRVLGSLHLPDSPTGRKTYGQFLRARMLEILRCGNVQEHEELWKEIRRGWCLGARDFQTRLVKLLDDRTDSHKRDSYSGNEMIQHDERAAESLLQRGLQALNLNEQTLLTGNKSSEDKCLLAWLIRRNTHVTNAWISERLQMGRADCLSRYPRRVEETRDPRLLRKRRALQKNTRIRD